MSLSKIRGLFSIKWENDGMGTGLNGHPIENMQLCASTLYANPLSKLREYIIEDRVGYVSSQFYADLGGLSNTRVQ